MVRWNRTCKDQTTGKAVVLLPKKEKNAPQYRLESSFGYTDHKFAIFYPGVGTEDSPALKNASEGRPRLVEQQYPTPKQR